MTALDRRAQLTEVAVGTASVPGGPVRVRLRGGLVAARLVSRDARQATVALVAGGALLLGGDRVVVRVRVADGCALDLIDVGGTVAYDAAGERSGWTADLHLGRDARLDWSGLPFVVASGADVVRTTAAHLGPGARLRLRETVVLGRSAEHGGRVALRTDVADDDGPLLVEGLDARGDRPVPGVLGGHRVLDTILCLHGGGEPDDVAEETCSCAPSGGPAVTLRLEHGGSLTRWLGAETHLSPLAPLPGAHDLHAPVREAP